MHFKRIRCEDTVTYPFIGLWP